MLIQMALRTEMKQTLNLVRPVCDKKVVGINIQKSQCKYEEEAHLLLQGDFHNQYHRYGDHED
jgi:hypothetical protein